jgi:hypothetical protein
VTFDLGALKTVKLPKPPLVRAGLRLFVFPLPRDTVAFLVARGVGDEVDDDWSGLSPVSFSARKG